MKVLYTPQFKRSLRGFPGVVRRKFYKQLGLLLGGIRHPSLHAKKYDESRNLWQARVDKSIRFYFVIEGDYYYLINIRKHK